MTGANPELGSVPAMIRAGISALHPSEQRVAQVFIDRPEWTIEASAQEVADAAGTSRATVVRAAQRLGFSGYPQLRVLLARDVGLAARGSEDTEPRDAVGVVRAVVRDLARAAEDLAALLDAQDVQTGVELLRSARSVLVIGNGLSAPVAMEAAMRLNAIGRSAEAPMDHVAQGVRARLLGPEDVCIVVSGSGSTRPTVQAARAARTAGAGLIALTAFTTSPLTEIATVSFVSALGASSFRDEITRTTRLSQTIMVNALIRALIQADPESARLAQARMLDVIGEVFLQDPP
ncbi:MurR/RpiR family transcriptional regulator [Ruania alba]|uniref:DNA-binding transcriptional regulator, MurR/RpiR family, contains HTH and SIS domains n=1 Tax=Ruania alba TaxID=648782 RepID=A0A1H5DD25_9MICO|nr:MurR/RpiR family transcriptional regulator [Ruania alba]SED76774.1 DNA-binding transcriptional regulator, MurR/RpiR family, contains HTH and SIS domains [Ruania alba]